MDGNYINGEPMKMQEASLLVKAYNTIMEWWKATKVVAPNWYMLDNKVQKEVKEAIGENDCTIELMPLDMH